MEHRDAGMAERERGQSEGTVRKHSRSVLVARSPWSREMQGWSFVMSVTVNSILPLSWAPEHTGRNDMYAWVWVSQGLHSHCL